MTPVPILCSRNAHDQNVLVRRPQWDQHGRHSSREKQQAWKDQLDRCRSLDARRGDPPVSPRVAHLAHPSCLARLALQFSDDSYLMRLRNTTLAQPVSDRRSTWRDSNEAGEGNHAMRALTSHSNKDSRPLFSHVAWLLVGQVLYTMRPTRAITKKSYHFWPVEKILTKRTITVGHR